MDNIGGDLNGSRNKERATAVLAKRTNLGNLNEVND